LPSGLWKCPNLRELSCQGSQLVHLPRDILVHCKCMSHAHEAACTQITSVSPAIGRMKHLTSLQAGLCRRLRFLPFEITHTLIPQYRHKLSFPAGEREAQSLPDLPRFPAGTPVHALAHALSTRARNHSTSSSQNHSRSKSWSLVSSFGNHLRKGQRQRYPLTWSRICTLQSAALSVRGMSLAILSATWPCGTEVVADAACVSAGRSSTITSPAGRPWKATTGVSPCCRSRAPTSAPDSSRTSWSPTARLCRLLHLHATTPMKTQTGIRNVGW
jgi:hypothetical protein